MSLVGPRPAIPYEVEYYPPDWCRRFSVKPGMTGLWQVGGRNLLNFGEMVQLDLDYAQRRSLWLNLRILAEDPMGRGTREGGCLMPDRRINIAVVGYGYWGPNIVRNVMERPELEFLGAVRARAASGAAKFSARYPGAHTTSSFEEVLADPTVNAVSIATPPRTHYALVKHALEAGKHVLVEKPLATHSAEAIELADMAEREGLVLMPGHTFLYSPAVNKVRQLIESGELGEVYFITSSRMNLGHLPGGRRGVRPCAA